MVVQHNLTAMNANRYLGINNSKLSKSLEKLSSGYAINRAGDNAAGLAVSEKMRSQIAGMTQGVKNAQDGISMVQTFEGALTETHSILQRMKTLADQMGNGSYDDAVDRAAAQQEFLQLNDELDQIADTDFNGVIVLNGGKMADGLSAVNGQFDYKNSTRDAKTLTSADVNTIDYQQFDDYDTANKVAANKIWNTIGGWNRTDTDATNDGPDSVDVTLKYDATSGTWSAVSANNGADYTKFTADTTKTNGGFTLKAGDEIATVVIDQTKLQNGDTITLTLNNPMSDIAAPTKIGAEKTNTAGFTEGTAAAAVKMQDANIVLALDAGLTDAKMTAGISKILDALQGATVEHTWDGKAEAANKTKITFSDGTTYTGNKTAADYTLQDGTKINLVTTDDGVTTIKSGATTIGTITLEGADADADQDSSGTIGWTVGLEYQSYNTSKLPTVEVKDSGTEVSKSNAYNNSEAILTYKDNITLQVGARTKDAVNFTFKYASTSIGDLKADLNCTATGLGTDKLNINTQEAANYAIDKIDQAINKVSLIRGTFGAIQNRLEHKIDNMNVSIENLTSAESAIRDTDMPTEMMNFTKQQILAQASQSMLAQANQLPQGVLSLLQ